MSASARTIVRYLLGELSDSARAALEADYVTDPRLLDEMVRTENELVDGYARGRLSSRTRRRFERAYLADPKRRERVEIAQALVAKLDGAESPRERVSRSTWVGMAMAATVLLVVAGGIRSFLESRRLRQEQTQAETVQPEIQRPPEQSAPPPPAPPERTASPTVVTQLFAVGGIRTRDTGPPITLDLPPGTEQVRLQLALKEADYRGYSAVLRVFGGPEIFARQNLRPTATGSGAVFEFMVPARDLATGDYILTLKGVRPDGEIDEVSQSVFRVNNATPR